MTYSNSSRSFSFDSPASVTHHASENSFCFSEVGEATYGASSSESEQNSHSGIAHVEELFSLFQSAKLFSVGVDHEQLKSALLEAVRLKSSGLFPDFIKPQVAVDECGEFMFTYKNSTGYIDIGVCGEGVISFHARNDADPEKTTYGDREWDRLSIPDELI